MSDVHAERSAAVAETIQAIRQIEESVGVTEAGLDAIKAQLATLGARGDLFSFEQFPAPAATDDAVSKNYRISQDDDDRFPLYIQATRGSISTAPHNHTTWACIVGIIGQEHNQFYDRDDDGAVTETSSFVVEAGTGVTMLPDDVHAIRIDGEALMFHCYGLAIERLVTRERYDEESKQWVNNAGPRVIYEARFTAPNG